MSRTLATACTCIVIGLVAAGLSSWAESGFLAEFLKGNLLVVLVALMAINTTTESVILTKMRELAADNPDGDFSRTRRSMRLATVEQLSLIVVAAVLLVLSESPKVVSALPHAGFIMTSLLVAVFAYALQVLYDTASGVYVILDYETEREPRDS